MGLAAPITPRLNTDSALSRGLVCVWPLLGTHRNLVGRTGDFSPGAAAGWTSRGTAKIKPTRSRPATILKVTVTATGW